MTTYLQVANLFPVLAVLFCIAALLSRRRLGRWRGQAMTWLWLAAVFAGVALWLRQA